MGTLDLRAREKGIERGLNFSSVVEKTAIEFDHAEEATKLTDGCRRTGGPRDPALCQEEGRNLRRRSDNRGK
jgi:hypothetical protein